MTATEQGYLLLFSNLGDGLRPLTPAEMGKLMQFSTRLPSKTLFEQRLTADLLKSLHMDSGLADAVIQRIERTDLLNAYLTIAAEQGISALTPASPDYPEAWRKRLGSRMPGALYLRGDRSLLSAPCIALVGSRNLRMANARFAQKIGYLAAEEGYVLVSGNARGADRTAQQACLDAGGSVISITPDALETLYPQRNQLFISAEGFQLEFSTPRALYRNGLIHTMGSMTIVAQVSEETGGTWAGAKENLEKHYSPLYVYEDGSKAADLLLSLGATAVHADLSSLHTLSPDQTSLFD